jgi:hypothetical protein
MSPSQCTRRFTATEQWDAECFAGAGSGVWDRTPFGPGGKWVWWSTDKTATDSFQSGVSFLVYPGSGHVVDVPLNATAYDAVVAEMKSGGWWDTQTRLVVVNVNLYNANLDVFQSVSLLAEQLASGALVVKDSRVATFPADAFRTTMQKVKLLFSLATFASTIFSTVIWCFQLWLAYRSVGWIHYVSNVWHLTDIVNNLLFFILYYYQFSFWLSAERQSLLSGNLSVRQEYVRLEVLANWRQSIEVFSAIAAVLSFMKVFKYLQVSARLNFLWNVLASAGTHLLSFLILFIIVFMSFSLMSHLLWGTFLENYRTFWSSSFSLTRMLFGDFIYDDLERPHPTLAPIFLNLYMVVIFFILINMFLAILNDTYAVQAHERKLMKRGELTRYAGRLTYLVKSVVYPVIGWPLAPRKVNLYSESRCIAMIIDKPEIFSKKGGATLDDIQAVLGPGAPKGCAARIILKHDKNRLRAKLPRADYYRVMRQIKEIAYGEGSLMPGGAAGRRGGGGGFAGGKGRSSETWYLSRASGAADWSDSSREEDDGSELDYEDDNVQGFRGRGGRRGRRGGEGDALPPALVARDELLDGGAAVGGAGASSLEMRIMAIQHELAALLQQVRTGAAGVGADSGGDEAAAAAAAAAGGGGRGGTGGSYAIRSQFLFGGGAASAAGPRDGRIGRDIGDWVQDDHEGSSSLSSRAARSKRRLTSEDSDRRLSSTSPDPRRGRGRTRLSDPSSSWSQSQSQGSDNE